MNENVPQYRKLYELLRKHIVSGVYEEGDLLPSENELCALHGMTRPTVRHALDTLVNEGLILKKQGKGSIVRKPPQNIGILSISGTASAIGVRYLRTDILQKPELRKWPDMFPFDLSEPESESGCIYMERLRYVDGQPVFYDINRLPNINLPRFTNRSLENKSLFEVLRKHYQVNVLGGEQQLKAIVPDARIKNILRLKSGQPVLYIERKLNTNKEGFNIYSTIYFNSEKHTIFGNF
ncbi:transcriptional regulator, GntR family [Mariniphaga anaerophila]|uniref:Transcriptional regulator, GntR family n=1 Tax=Mariniphaga anaerophila TaxID=1484053 RepID=A0A1M4YCA9_9BACT|nr:GntR family transcriptional regulator [Mariniphaga anaerophila]SHF03367.1 transcriptional regulator, GntR family [Mariniphaga anaerophila]